MAIGNVTPDSFYAASRLQSEQALLAWAKGAIEDGAAILDIGACSTRPGSVPASEEEEWKRLEPALRVLRDALPDVPLSIDTFRPEIARRALEQFGRMTINDISGGCEAMYDVVRQFGVPYIWTLCGDLDLPTRHPGMNDIDLILDPGFGFAKTVDQNYELFRAIDRFQAFGKPILVGISRKSMIYRLFGITPEEALPATQALHLAALQKGADILRVHDVAEAARTVEVYRRIS